MLTNVILGFVIVEFCLKETRVIRLLVKMVSEVCGFRGFEVMCEFVDFPLWPAHHFRKYFLHFIFVQRF